MNKTLHHKFSDFVPEPKKLELHVGTCAKPPKHFNPFDASRSDFFSLAILINGEATMKINLKEKKISKNALVFLTPNTLKQLLNHSPDTEIYSVIFTSKFLLHIGIQQQEIEMIDFITRSNEAVLCLEQSEVDHLKKVIEDLKEKNDHMTEHPFGENIVQYSFRIFLSEMAAIGVKYNVSEKNKSSRKQDLVMRFANLVNQHFKEHRTVKYYADQLSITPKYLTEIVHEVTGNSASVVIDEKVMYEAKLLLKDPKLTISQIAEVLHFSDQSFLGKFFKRHLGVSPSEYRHHNFGQVI